MNSQNSQPQPDTPASPRSPRRKRTPRVRELSAKYMTLRQAADHYCVDESTIRKGLGVFNRLALISTCRRTIILRSSVERLDRDLERTALGPEVVSIDEHRKSA